jgi:hypothetical protein
MDQDFPMVGSETAWESFALSVQRLLKLAEVAVKPPAALKSDGRSLAVHLAQRLAEDPRAAAYAAGYTVLSLLRGVIGEGSSGEDGRRLVDHWCLDRKLRESYQDAGFPADESHRMVELLKLVLSRTVGSASGYPYPKDAELGGVPALMHGLFSDTDTRSYLGVNVYQDASWFVKERFEESLFYAILLGALESEEAFPLASSGQADRPVQAKLPVPAKPGRSLTPHPSQLRVGAWSLRLSALAELRAQLDSVKEKSGYRVETFLELAETFFPRTEPVPAAKVPAASKPAAAKVPAASKPAAAKVPAAKESGTKKPQRTTKKT